MDAGTMWGMHLAYVSSRLSTTYVLSRYADTTCTVIVS